MRCRWSNLFPWFESGWLQIERQLPQIEFSAQFARNRLFVIPSRREESTNQITRPAAVKVLHIQLNQVSEVDIEEMFSYADQVSEYAV